MGFSSVRVVNEVLNGMRPVVIGRDPFDHEVIIHELTQVNGWHHFRHSRNCALDGIDMAPWDLVGNGAGLPPYKLFGAAFRKQIPYYWYFPNKQFKLMAETVQQGVAQGFDTVYVKLGTGVEHDLEVVRTLREAIGPGPKLRVDANEALSNGTAVGLMRRMAQYDIEFFEQPLLFYDHERAAEFRRGLGLPVGANQSAWDESDLLEIIKKTSGGCCSDRPAPTRKLFEVPASHVAIGDGGDSGFEAQFWRPGNLDSSRHARHGKLRELHKGQPDPPHGTQRRYCGRWVTHVYQRLPDASRGTGAGSET